MDVFEYSDHDGSTCIVRNRDDVKVAGDKTGMTALVTQRPG